jgi:metal-responsive CopG/Arc/MetJ family transcriptional regulator
VCILNRIGVAFESDFPKRFDRWTGYRSCTNRSGAIRDMRGDCSVTALLIVYGKSAGVSQFAGRFVRRKGLRYRRLGMTVPANLLERCRKPGRENSVIR